MALARRPAPAVIHVDRTVGVARSPETVFDYLADLRHFLAWQPAIERAEQLDAGPAAQGTRFRLVLRGPAGPIEAVGEVTAMDRPRLIAVRSVEGPAPLEARTELTPDATGTRVRLIADLGLGGLYRFAEGLVRERLDSTLPEALADLARHIEADTPAS